MTVCLARRRLLTLAGGGFLAAPAAAQQRLPVVGYLAGQSTAAAAPLRAAFTIGLAQTGFRDGQNVTIDFQSSDGQADRLPGLARELVSRPVTVIFASSTGAARAAKAATASIPIVYTGASDPVALGLAASLARPGGNLTGATMYAHTYAAKRLEILHELVPAARTVGILINPSNPSAAQERADIESAARTLGLEPLFAEAAGRDTIANALEALVGDGVRPVYMVDDPLFTSSRTEIMTQAQRRSLAILSTLEAQAAAGALASYGTDFADMHRLCGGYVGRILKGETPGDLPIILPTRFRLVINLKTARSLALTVSSELLTRADEVIE